MYNSTWQNLHYRRPRLENEFYHGEIIRLGRECGVPTPVNERARLSNLLLTMAQAMELEVDRFADSTGTLAEVRA